MKQILQKPSLGSFTPLLFVVVFAVLFQPSPVAPVNTPVTQPVAQSPPSSVPVASVHQNHTPNTAPPEQKQSVADTAPKQAAIIASVATEYVYHMFGSVNDPRAVTDWTLTKDNAPAAWDITTGNNQTIVADIDTGFALTHEDLVNQWYQNAGEIGMTKLGDRCWTGTPQDKSTNNCDDDTNGYVDDWRGWNFVKADNNPQTGRINPTGTGVSHGTATAGFIGASGNNGVGSTAINQHTKIMPLTVLDDDGVGYTSAIAAALYYAVDNGATVINLSLGTYANDPTLRTAISYALAHNVVVVAAAGNCGGGISSDCPTAGGIAYPALYPDVISVGGSTSSDTRSGFSSYGTALDISAPGSNLPVAPMWTPSNQTSAYATSLYGTSFASPQVASLAALIKSIRPSTSVADITAIIDGTATKPASMNGIAYTTDLGHGIINAGSALSTAQALNATSGTPLLLQTGGPLSEHQVFATATMSSGCQIATGLCTIEMTDSNGYKRYLPYATVTSGNAGWAWSSDMLTASSYEIRARSGDNLSTTPYLLFKKG